MHITFVDYMYLYIQNLESNSQVPHFKKELGSFLLVCHLNLQELI